MKFYAEPNLTVIQRVKNTFTKEFKNKLVCKFDENGELKTFDPIIQDILKTKFKECTWDEESILNKKRKCKKCDYECENQGQLLIHYREIHPKKED